MKYLPIAFGLLLFVLFDMLFWHEKLGVNSLIYSTLLVTAMSILYAKHLKNLPTLVLLACTILSAGMITWHSSIVAQIGFFVSLGLFMVFLHQPTLKALHYALAYILVAFEGTLTGAINYGITTFTTPQIKNNKQAVWVQYVRVSLLPLLFFAIFFIIFKVANPIFNNLTNKALEYTLSWCTTFWKHLDIARFFFWLLGIFGLGMCLYAWQVGKFWGLQEEKEEEVIMRKRLETTYNTMYPPNALSLKNEYRMGILLMAMVNGLLFFRQFN